MERKARIFAYYLPQFHPSIENDRWWGKGFTEWTNVTKAKPLYAGHWQPRFPADLGYYDLRVPEVREAQAEMAAEHGVEGFCYYHYWFGDGRRLLERPFNEVIESGKPDFPFMLCWANHTWSGVWYGAPDKVLMEQRYPGRDDHARHFESLIKAFEDERYARVEGKPVFQILIPSGLPNILETTDTFRELANAHGLKGIYLVAGYYYENDRDPRADGFDAVVSRRVLDVYSALDSRRKVFLSRLIANRYYSNEKLQHLLRRYFLRRYDYKDVISFIDAEESADYPYFPCVLSNWDNTPRSGVRGVIVEGATPKLFEGHLANAVNYVQSASPEERIIFLKSWNEWAEGNYVEPDTVFGMGYLDAIKNVIRG